MKKLIITTKQLSRIDEENNVNVAVNTNGNTVSDAINAVTRAKPDITKAGNIGDPVLHISNLASQGGSNDNQITQHVEVGANETPEQAMAAQLNPNATSNGTDIEVSGDGLKEGKIFKKREIEEARLRKMKLEGRVMTKKQLRESFK